MCWHITNWIDELPTQQYLFWVTLFNNNALFKAIISPILKKSKKLGGFIPSSVPTLLFGSQCQSLNLLARSVPSYKWALWCAQVAAVGVSCSEKQFPFSSSVYTKDYPLHLVEDSLVMQNSIKILKQIKTVLQAPKCSVYSPICFNHNMIPSQSDQALKSLEG